MGSSNEGVVLRRFDELHARTFLKMQDDIVRLEEELHEIDQKHMVINESDVYVNGSFRHDEKQGRKDSTNPLARRSNILSELENKFSKYGECKVLVVTKTLAS